MSGWRVSENSKWSIRIFQRRKFRLCSWFLWRDFFRLFAFGWILAGLAWFSGRTILIFLCNFNVRGRLVLCLVVWLVTGRFFLILNLSLTLFRLNSLCIFDLIVVGGRDCSRRSGWLHKCFLSFIVSLTISLFFSSFCRFCRSEALETDLKMVFSFVTGGKLAYYLLFYVRLCLVSLSSLLCSCLQDRKWQL